MTPLTQRPDYPWVPLCVLLYSRRPLASLAWQADLLVSTQPSSYFDDDMES